MKLIISGATGFLGTELVRQSLRMPAVTSVIALGRRPVTLPDGAEGALKLKNVVVEEFGAYADDVRKQFEGANACIWTIAITPTKAKTVTPDYVKLVSQTYAVGFLKVLSECSPAKPFRYLYVSGAAAERDQTKKPMIMPEYVLMRGEAENLLLRIAEESKGTLDVSIAKPGLILKPGMSMRTMASSVATAIGLFPSVGVVQCAAAMLDQAVNGFEKETLWNSDLQSIGGKVLQ
ncbi:uncharacterized protein DNG_10453 [Cephalotrichum gorgonifer]|uniref:NAD(P)-binding domain-containing protein n=1 Tax=Cephalotrichum gorgonifer TaxID=2041049 RepID=A0AAE8N8Y0_9PEZI|nr:uncharacterized protein DNG_10453 [Cephalotrichum gorgonifer]